MATSAYEELRRLADPQHSMSPRATLVSDNAAEVRPAAHQRESSSFTKFLVVVVLAAALLAVVCRTTSMKMPTLDPPLSDDRPDARVSSDPLFQYF